MSKRIIALIALCMGPHALSAQNIDTFSDVGSWKAAPASGVELHLSADSGRTGTSLRVDFDFHGRGGWAAFRKEATIALPENYEISFWLKADAPRNTLELKLVDPSGENVWWVNRPEFDFAGDWRKVTFRKRHVMFAWGPAGGGDIRKLGAIEFAITAGSGGKGTVWIDDLTITARDVIRPYDATPVVSNTANTRTIDFTRTREYGGVVVDWRDGAPPRDYEVQVSQDGSSWQTVRGVRRGARQSDYVQLPEIESRFLRLEILGAARSADISGVRMMPVEWGTKRNALFDTIAAHASKGSYPKYFTGEQSYWTVIGENGDPTEALMNEEGAVEVDKRSFSIEPFLYQDNKLITWHDVQLTQSLHEGVLPIPTVTWRTGDAALEVTSWAQGGILWLKYRVAHAASKRATLYIAVRPFQVNPSTQFLNNPGGATTIRTVAREADGTIVIDSTRIVPLTTPAAFGALTFDEGDIVDFIRKGVTPTSTSVRDTAGGASAVLAYPLDSTSTRFHEFYLAVPRASTLRPGDPQTSLRIAVDSWRNEITGFNAILPDQHLMASIRSNLAYILINRDRAAIQPGSRSYERSWIRDGSLTSAALLRLGHHKEVREFIEWFAPFQYADGKVPCCVDRQGAGAVPENDSHGQLIYVITEYFRYTRDTAFVRRMYPHVERAVAYMDSLRASRRTLQYRGTPLFGLMPQSISHEGYSAKPMHSYWDDFFALKGFKDAAWLAHNLRDSKHEIAWAHSRDEFQGDLIQSLQAAMRQHGIDYLPGAAELGDFDATSTTVGVDPASAQRVLPAEALKRTFDRYWESFVARRDSNKWEAYTPYEWRVVGTYVRLGYKERAHALVDWFMQHQRPSGWNHWAEVVYRERNAPHFIGDMPHTWVGSDFIRSVLDMLAYDDDGTVVLAAGVKPEWVKSEIGISVSGLQTPYGPISYEMIQRGREVHVTFNQRATAPPHGFVLRSPLPTAIRSANADGAPIATDGREVRMTVLPHQLVLTY